MSQTRVQQAADQLYGVLPAEFVALRKALAAQAKAEGDGDAAKAIAALRKPNQAGWLVNLLVREEAEQITTLLELGAAMRKAQSRLAAADLKALSAQRQKLVRAMASQAYDLAVDQGETVSRTVLNQVEDTLSAALADPDAAEQVRAGTLTGPLTYSGFGPVGLSLVPTPAESAQAPVDEGSEQEKAVRRARVEHARQVQEATAAVTVAQRAVVKSDKLGEALVRTRDKAQASAAQAQAAVDELTAQLERAHKAAQTAQGKVEAAEDALTENQSQAEQARLQLAEAQQALTELEANAPE